MPQTIELPGLNLILDVDDKDKTLTIRCGGSQDLFIKKQKVEIGGPGDLRFEFKEVIIKVGDQCADDDIDSGS